MFRGIDLYSDTLTQPSIGMRKAMAEAAVGDEQKREDPTTLALEDKICELLGKTAALFLPSATMANQIALQAQCRPGDEIIAWEGCHLLKAEAGGPAVHARVMVCPIQSTDGTYTGEEIVRSFRKGEDPHDSPSKLVCVENTANMAGGTAWPVEKLESVVSTARSLKLRLHLDGARIFNAATRAKMAPSRIASGFDTVTVCLSKGLGCPVGAVIAFDRERLGEFRRLKQVMGGAMRQSGILAAAGLYALKHNVARLEDDHENASWLAQKLRALSCVDVENPEPSTNMVFFRWTSPAMPAADFHERCLAQGLRFSVVGDNRFRAVTHLDIQRKDIDQAIDIITSIGTSS